MSRRSYVPFIIACVAVVIIGLALGKDRGDETSLINSVSQLVLTVGFLGVVVTATLELVGRARTQSHRRR